MRNYLIFILMLFSFSCAGLSLYSYIHWQGGLTSMIFLFLNMACGIYNLVCLSKDDNSKK